MISADEVDEVGWPELALEVISMDVTRKRLAQSSNWLTKSADILTTGKLDRLKTMNWKKSKCKNHQKCPFANSRKKLSYEQEYLSKEMCVWET